MQRPTAVPRMPASESGVSTQRSGPKRSRSPAVARKTPPARPTSSPMTITESSRSRSVWRASLIASTSKRSANGASENPAQLGEVAFERRGRIGVRMPEEELRVGLGLRLRSRDPRAHQVDRLGADRLRERVAEDPGASEISLVAADALAP